MKLRIWLAKIKKKFTYILPEWKWELYKIADEVGKPDIGQIMGKAILQLIFMMIKGRLLILLKKLGREVTKTKYIGKLDEYKSLMMH